MTPILISSLEAEGTIPPQTSEAQTRSILVVEDETDLRTSLEATLRQAGHKVIGTSSREEVLALLQSKNFDVVLTDVLMPDIDGTEVITATQKYQCGTAILAMSGGGVLTQTELCRTVTRALGAGVFLMKPFGPAALFSAIENALSQVRCLARDYH